MFDIPSNDEAMEDDAHDRERDVELEKKLGTDESIDEELLGVKVNKKPEQDNKH